MAVGIPQSTSGANPVTFTSSSSGTASLSASPMIEIDWPPPPTSKPLWVKGPKTGTGLASVTTTPVITTPPTVMSYVPGSLMFDISTL